MDNIPRPSEGLSQVEETCEMCGYPAECFCQVKDRAGNTRPMALCRDCREYFDILYGPSTGLKLTKRGLE